MTSSPNETINPGDTPSASLWDYLRRIALRMSNFTVSSPLEMVETTTSRHVRVNLPAEFWAKVDFADSSGNYPWVEVIPLENGQWKDGDRQGTSDSFPAVEVNKNINVATGTIVRMFDPMGSKKYVFVYSRC